MRITRESARILRELYFNAESGSFLSKRKEAKTLRGWCEISSYNGSTIKVLKECVAEGILVAEGNMEVKGKLFGHYSVNKRAIVKVIEDDKAIMDVLYDYFVILKK